jgi:enamine deaminase RidA (YjgF/YER057c/UK114 family)
MRRSLTCLCLALGGFASSALADSGKTIVIPEHMDRAYDDYHYAPAVRVGDMVIVSGIPAGKGATYEERIRNMFERLKTTLAAAGASLGDVVEITTFHREPKDTDAFDEEFKKFLVVHNEYFKDGYPAWTAVGTTALLSKDAPVEMRAVAMIGAGKKITVQRAKPSP